MYNKQCIVTLDLEGVLAPEIWIAVAQKTGIEDLKLTTKDIVDYDELMQGRLQILKRENLKLSDIQNIIGNLGLLKGAKEFLDELRRHTQVIILSDTFLDFAFPIMKALDFPTIFCHRLIVKDDYIQSYELRMKDQKTKTVQSLQALNYKVFAAGDSFNDTGMLLAADKGVFFNAPDSISKQFPNLVSTQSYSELMREFEVFYDSI
jgi:phosphoserine/homoserine phosphotransferase